MEDQKTVLLKDGKSIVQSDFYFKLTQDTVLLADFVRLKSGERGLDLGAGIGCLAILILLDCPGRMDGIELIPGAARLARDNYARCGLTARGDILEGDFTALPAQSTGQYDVCVSNPPYYQNGPVARYGALAAARNSTAANLAQVCAAAAGALKTGGRFYVCVKPERLAGLFALLHQNRLGAKRLRLVHHRLEQDAILALVEARCRRDCQLEVLPPLTIMCGEGHSAEYRRIYQGESS